MRSSKKRHRKEASAHPDSEKGTPKDILDVESAKGSEHPSGGKKRGGTRSFGAWAASFLAVVIAFAIGPLAGFYASKYARANFDEFFSTLMNSAQEEIAKKTIPFLRPDGTIGQAPVGPSLDKSGFKIQELHDFQSLDNFCDADFMELDGDLKDFKSEVCEPYHDTRKAHIYAIVSLVLSPFIPLLMSLVVAILHTRIKEGRSSGGLTSWFLMKGINKIIGLETIPFGFALWYSSSLTPIPERVAWWLALIIAGILFGVKVAAVEHYTEGVITMETEAGGPP
jgi:hypothetical protein